LDGAKPSKAKQSKVVQKTGEDQGLYTKRDGGEGIKIRDQPINNEIWLVDYRENH